MQIANGDEPKHEPSQVVKDIVKPQVSLYKLSSTNFRTDVRSISRNCTNKPARISYHFKISSLKLIPVGLGVNLCLPIYSIITAY